MSAADDRFTLAKRFLQEEGLPLLIGKLLLQLFDDHYERARVYVRSLANTARLQPLYLLLEIELLKRRVAELESKK